jgi:nucleoside-diphosphate-sugar epimerase
MKKKVLMTGASGRIGQMLTSELADQYDFRLTDVKPLEETHGFDFVQADLADMAAIRPLCQNIDTVIHLGADPRTTAPWETLLPSNIIGTYNVLQSAHEANCRRVIYASSINAVAGYPQELQIRTDMPVRPPNLYGATKAWGEAVGRYYADELGLSCFCLRFGWVLPRDSDRIQPDQDLLDILLTYDDLARLMVACLEAPDPVHFGIFHVLSNNRRNRLDISETRRILGYEPQDDGFALAEAKKAAKTDD